MTIFAMLFPGQGSQYLGMLSSFLDKENKILKNTFNEASSYINYDLLKLIKEGPLIKLNQNQYTQVSILTASVSLYRFWISENGQYPSIMSGHSLGEYSALVCSNSMTFYDALKIVFLRGKMMQKIIVNRPVLMQAIIGIDERKVHTACFMASKKKNIVSLASINSDNQIIISGDKSAVYEAGLNCKKFGAKHVINLNTNVPAHCKLLKPISKKLKKILKSITLYPPQIPVVNNIDVKSENNSKKIKNALIKQIYSTVRWKEIIDFIKSKKIFITLEVGPNRILTNLNKKNKNITALHTNNLKNFLIASEKINKGINEKK